MKLIDMKPPREAPNPSPYGLRLTLNQEQLQALGFKDLPVAGTELHIEAMATVTRSSTEDPDADGDIDYVCVELQLTELGCEVDEKQPEPENTVARRLRQGRKLYNPPGRPDTDGGGNFGPYGALVKPVGG
jgi:hypothetical protein